MSSAHARRAAEHPAIRALLSRVRAFRQLGALRGSAVAARHILRGVRGRVRALWLVRHPIALVPGELAMALGSRDVGSVLATAELSLPCVARAIIRTEELDDDAKARLIAVADRVAAHEFDLLGSGPVQLGAPIDWQRDFKSGRRWPLDHISKIVVSYPDNSDIKVPWELSRCQHLPVLALAHRLTGDRRYLDEIGAQITGWVAANPVEFGANWQCTMDVAIRAVNWTATLVICGNEPAARDWLDQALAGLLLHARFIRSNLEYGPARGNHYLADVVGLLVTASLFQASSEGRRWIAWAVGQLGTELRHQIRPDGCDHEASTSYHRLVTEMFLVGADASDALAPGTLDPAVRPTLDLMLQFVADYTRPDGRAPQIGDADNGRLLPLEDYGGSDQRRHLHLFRQANAPYSPAKAPAAYPSSGFFFLRSDQMFAAVRCGDVGIYGRGCHSHNDLLGFELCWESVPLVVDPGSYVYTADPGLRNRFRSTAAHATLQVDELEQNPVPLDRLFAMPDTAQAEVLAWQPGSTTVLQGRHRGYSMPGDRCIHTRTIRMDGAQARFEITDEIETQASHRLTWRFPLAPCEVDADAGGAEARFPGLTLRIACEQLDVTVEPGLLSPGYGERYPAPVVVFRGSCGPGRFVTDISLTLIAE